MTKQAVPSKNGVTNDVDTDALRSAFTGAALGMSWQLAAVVLVTIFGGYKLDQATGHAPLFTLLGLVLAIILSVLIIRRALSSVNNFNVAKDKDA